MPHLSSLSMSMTLSNFLSISTGSNHEANDCEVKTPHIEEHKVWNDDAAVETEANACADDDVDEDETDDHVEVEVGNTELVIIGIDYPGRIGMDSSVPSVVPRCRPVLRFSGSCLGKSPES